MTDNKEDRIADIVDGMQFDRRPPVSKAVKAKYAVLESGIGDALKDLNKLHLRLSGAASQRDYHSLSLDEARRILGDIRNRLDALSKME